MVQSLQWQKTRALSIGVPQGRYTTLLSLYHYLLFQFLGIDVSLNATCEESELTNDDYLKILWAAAAELPGTCICIYCNVNVILTF